VVLAERYLELAVRCIHDEFELGETPAKVEL
jgi:hypothetical protein